MQDSVIRCGNLVVTPVVTDVILAKAYIKMLEEGTLDTVFYESHMSLSEFMIAYLTKGQRVCLGCFRERDNAEPELCGLGWVFSAVKMAGFTRAEAGMWFSSRQTDKRDNLRFGQMMLRSFFCQYPIDVIFGCTPEQNTLALRYARKLGFLMTGPVPSMCAWKGQLADGWISTMKKEDWEARNIT